MSLQPRLTEAQLREILVGLLATAASLGDPATVRRILRALVEHDEMWRLVGEAHAANERKEADEAIEVEEVLPPSEIHRRYRSH